ncbi:MAG: lytic transglycosylase [Gammaproteobacteria bacterium]|nr:MAG: lytic transglycosylase [Gammaproteobacteria bacterium]
MRIKKILQSPLFRFYGLVILTGLLFACSSVPKNPRGIENACDILDTDDSWRQAFDSTYRKYGVPPHVVMAIIYQESRFVADARPPRQRFLGIPTTRPSTAYGYAQALDSTWDWYRDKSGNRGADRDNLVDAVDFIGWYIQSNYDRTNVSKWSAKDQYLAYHEGSGGYLKQSYENKPWLLAVSDKVARRAATYRRQLSRCYTLTPP